MSKWPLYSKIYIKKKKHISHRFIYKSLSQRYSRTSHSDFKLFFFFNLKIITSFNRDRNQSCTNYRYRIFTFEQHEILIVKASREVQVFVRLSRSVQRSNEKSHNSSVKSLFMLRICEYGITRAKKNRDFPRERAVPV